MSQRFPPIWLDSIVCESKGRCRTKPRCREAFQALQHAVSLNPFPKESYGNYLKEAVRIGDVPRIRIQGTSIERIFWEKLTGRYAWAFWTMVVLNFVIPVGILSRKKTRTVTGTVIASAGVIVGMWLERFQIVVPTLVNPRLPYTRGVYWPSIHEILIAMGCFALFILFYVVFARVFPVVSIWEVKAGRKYGVQDTVERVKGYQP